MVAGAGWVRADDDPFAEPMSWVDVLVQVELIEVTHGKLTELLRTPELVRDAMALRVKSQELVRGREATIVHTMMVRTREESQAVSRSVRESIHPTEYEPPEWPNGIGNASANPGGKPQERTAEQPNTPTAFERRDLGELMTVGVTVNRGRGTVGVKMQLELARSMGVVEWARRKTPGGNDYATGMVDIESLKSAPKLDVPDGGYGFAGILQRESDPEKRLLVFVRCDLLVPEPEPAR